jgi:hypothetical protein
MFPVTAHLEHFGNILHVKIAVFWVVVWQKFTDVSEVLAAFIIMAMSKCIYIHFSIDHVIVKDSK